MSPHVPSVQLTQRTPAVTDVREEVLAGLSDSPKHLPPKLFYDGRGSQLFDRITRQPEYYLTRTETAILAGIGPDLRRKVGSSVAVVELGSGSGEKTHQLLRHLPNAAMYVAIDISADALRTALPALAAVFPDKEISGVAADYLSPVTLPPAVREHPVLLVFFGSTLGNFEPEAARRFLAQWASALGPGDGLLIGIDGKKDPARLYAAYNDAEGVTADFNRNVLTRINREVGADFVESQFAHRAVYHAEAGRIEMALVSLRAQTVTVAGRPIHFADGEPIVTEHSYKYTPAEFQTLARLAGWEPVEVWQDPEKLFHLHYLRPEDVSSETAARR